MQPGLNYKLLTHVKHVNLGFSSFGGKWGGGLLTAIISICGAKKCSWLPTNTHDTVCVLFQQSGVSGFYLLHLANCNCTMTPLERMTDHRSDFFW